MPGTGNKEVHCLESPRPAVLALLGNFPEVQIYRASPYTYYVRNSGCKPSNLCLTNPPGDTAAFWSLRMTTVENLMVRATKSLLFMITMCQQFKTMPVMKYSTSLGQSASAVPVLVRVPVLHKLLSFYSRDGEHPRPQPMQMTKL